MGSKLAFIIFNAISFSGYGLIILLNIGDAKAWILFVIAVFYGIARLVFYISRQVQERTMRNLDIKERRNKIKSNTTPNS